MAVLIYRTDCRAAASVANVAYILRENACHVWATQNIDLHGKTDALSYAERREWEESLKPVRGGTEPRNHTRLQLSFASETNPDRAMHAARIFFKRTFPEARAILALHTDTANLHVHVWIDNRTTDNKKLHLPRAQYKSLRSNWTKFTDEIYATNYEAQFTDLSRVRTTKYEQLTKRKEGELNNEQGRIIDGEQLVATAERNIEQADREINARAQYVANPNRQGFQPERPRPDEGMDAPSPPTSNPTRRPTTPSPGRRTH
jgi:hypothetical protein